MDNYNLFYEVLSNIREIFHSKGRLDDSNEKLDEVIKILVINYYVSTRMKEKFNIGFVEKYALRKINNKDNIAKALRLLFKDIVSDEIFFNDDGTNIFGSNRNLNIQHNEDEFAKLLIYEISKIDFQSYNKGMKFDIINECFGNFVRENFRNNKEDAQYMTPSEIAVPILEALFFDVINDNVFKNKLMSSTNNITILDPTCGVGTLPLEFIRITLKYIKNMNIEDELKEDIILKLKNNCVFGQDKVDRMTRLSKINALMYGINIENFQQGNSIDGKTFIDKFRGKTDIILSNPPFGAEFKFEEISNKEYFPILSDICKPNTVVCSELLILDKSLELLRENGKMIIIVPDSVLSAKGLNEKFREILLEKINVKAIIDLPNIAFAQAGTRINCSVMYLEKKSIQQNNIFMGICNNIGFNVKDRVGIPIKYSVANNELEIVCKKYVQWSKKNIEIEEIEIISDSPSCTSIRKEKIIDMILKPSFYDSERINTIRKISNIKTDNYEIRNLEELVEFETRNRKKLFLAKGYKHISVLHIRNDYTIDFKKVSEFKSVSKGRECFENDIIFSKINPHISRVAIIPKCKSNLLCSNEFEILRVKEGVSPFILMILLNNDLVKKQIISYTSGTSSSHSRIKEDQLRKIKVPYPIKGSKKNYRYEELAKMIKEIIEEKYTNENRLYKIEKELFD